MILQIKFWNGNLYIFCNVSSTVFYVWNCYQIELDVEFDIVDEFHGEEKEGWVMHLAIVLGSETMNPIFMLFFLSCVVTNLGNTCGLLYAEET